MLLFKKNLPKNAITFDVLKYIFYYFQIFLDHAITKISFIVIIFLFALFFKRIKIVTKIKGM
jgi:hypothetical protein